MAFNSPLVNFDQFAMNSAPGSFSPDVRTAKQKQIQNVSGMNNGLTGQQQQNLAPITGQDTRDFSQFGDINTQNAIRDLTNEMGIGNAVNVVNGVLVDQFGNPVAGAPNEADFNTALQMRLGGQAGPVPNMAGPGSTGATVIPNNNAVVNASRPNGVVAPPTGLIGSEQALQAGLTGALNVVGQGIIQGRSDLISGQEGAQNQLNTASQNLGQNAQNIFAQASDPLRQGQTQLNQASNTLGQNAQNIFAQATDPLSQFTAPGVQAGDQQAALSGALGPEAQSQAFAALQNSPGQEFSRDKQEEALLRNASATGGLGGGRVLEALQREAAGNAAQNFQQQFQNLGDVANRGLTAEQQRATIGGQLGGQFLGQQGQLDAAGIDLKRGIANLGGQLGGQFLGQQGQIDLAGANLTSQTGSQLANQAFQGGIGAGNLISGTGSEVSRGRLDTGTQIANAISNTTSGLADLVNKQGAGTSDLIGTGGGNLINVISNFAQQLGVSEEQLGALLANISVGEGTTIANQTKTGNLVPQGTMMRDTGMILQGVQNAMNSVNSNNQT